jgi:hypothetical protein
LKLTLVTNIWIVKRYWRKVITKVKSSCKYAFSWCSATTGTLRLTQCLERTYCFLSSSHRLIQRLRGMSIGWVCVSNDQDLFYWCAHSQQLLLISGNNLWVHATIMSVPSKWQRPQCRLTPLTKIATGEICGEGEPRFASSPVYYSPTVWDRAKICEATPPLV